MSKNHANNAAANFNDNVRRLGGLQAATTDPQAYNLNVGLSNLASAVAGLYDEVQRLRQEVAALKRG
jgi:hypothetical protein